jgi:type 1 glutamine amidotransferase
MLGGEFRTHGRQCAVDGMIHDPKHPAMAPVVEAGQKPSATMPDLKVNTYPTGKIWKFYDEMYLLKNVDRANMRVLLWLDRGFDDGTPEAGKPGEYLIAWCKAYGKGRVFYTSLGHRQEIWRDPVYQKHITGGIKFALGLAKGSTKPNPAGTP